MSLLLTRDQRAPRQRTLLAAGNEIEAGKIKFEVCSPDSPEDRIDYWRRADVVLAEEILAAMPAGEPLSPTMVARRVDAIRRTGAAAELRDGPKVKPNLRNQVKACLDELAESDPRVEKRGRSFVRVNAFVASTVAASESAAAIEVTSLKRFPRTVIPGVQEGTGD